jgi:hypothetical protein
MTRLEETRPSLCAADLNRLPRRISCSTLSPGASGVHHGCMPVIQLQEYHKQSVPKLDGAVWTSDGHLQLSPHQVRQIFSLTDKEYVCTHNACYNSQYFSKHVRATHCNVSTWRICVMPADVSDLSGRLVKVLR